MNDVLKQIRKERGITLRNIRKEAGLTQIELSLLANIGATTIKTMEKGEIGWTSDCEMLFIAACEKYSRKVRGVNNLNNSKPL